MHLPRFLLTRSWQSLTLGLTRVSNLILRTVGAGVVNTTFFCLVDVSDSAGAGMRLGGHGDN